MKKIIFALPGNELLAESLTKKLNADSGELIIRHFPDGESYINVISDVSNKEVIIVCTLHQPDDKLLPLFFLSKNLKDLKAKKITLIAPYLAYMRQDKKFSPGEAVTSAYFAKLISSFADELITIDPHLHRRHSMSEIYSIPCKVLHASELISNYIKEKIKNPLLIGPDSESEQWVSEVAKNAGAPFIVLQKERFGDKDVKVSVPHVEKYKDQTPVLVDDIVSTAHTMIETITHLKAAGMKAPVCIGVHAVFAGNAFEELKRSGATEIISCNTIDHVSNRIDITDLIAKNCDVNPN
jgi:ribose-phosphate pyrophosphokinase